jgi:Polysaccharide deacetylase
MVDHGYEIGNHTWQHTNLTNIPNQEFMMTLGEPQIYMTNLLGDHPGNASDILTLPYGTTPDGDLHPDQRVMLRDGFHYNGHQIHFRGALLVGADPAPSPASTHWDKLWIPRVQMFDESTDFWFGMIERGEIVVYTSDGNPTTISVPDPLHASLESLFNVEGLTSSGKTIIRYNHQDGTTLSVTNGDGVPVRNARREGDAGSAVPA